jgi:hypothetical protein
MSVDRAAIAAHAERQAEYARAEARRWTDVAEAFDRVAERYANPMKETENDSEAA